MGLSQQVVNEIDTGKNKDVMFQVHVPVYLGVKEFCQRFSFIKETTIRWQIHSRDTLGISEVFIKPFGQRKVLIDVSRYFQLMKELGR